VLVNDFDQRFRRILATSFVHYPSAFETRMSLGGHGEAGKEDSKDDKPMSHGVVPQARIDTGLAGKVPARIRLISARRSYCPKVLQAEMEPEFRPLENQVIRCSELP